VQNTIALTARTRLILGVKIEDDPYVDPEILPNARLSWSPNADVMLWAAASRAVRSPTPFDRDVIERIGAVTFLVGDTDFQHEELTAYELGGRFHPMEGVSLSVSAFHNIYDNLRSIEFAPGGGLPLQWDNGVEGETYGLEVWGDVQARRWWRLSAGFTALEKRLRFKPDSSGLLGSAQTANDPDFTASLRSAMDLTDVLTLDAQVRYVSALPEPRVDSYFDLDARLGWDVTEHVQVSLIGRNLLEERHLEYPGANAAERSVLAALQWRF
jgi:iron complex outermembrane recepter protein